MIDAPTLFYHGLPGAPDDAELLAHGASTAVDWLAALAPQVAFDAALVQQFDAKAPDGPAVHLIGFSLGAMAALTIAAARPERVAKVTLISPAGPWAQGRFADKMAGASVFKLAEAGPKRLIALSALQMMALRFAPNLFLKALFGKSCAAEQTFLENPENKIQIATAYSRMYATHFHPYIKALRHYATQWTATPIPPRIDVDIIHGTLDTWTPPEMARALREQISATAQLQLIQGTGHYSTLRAANLTKDPLAP